MSVFRSPGGLHRGGKVIRTAGVSIEGRWDGSPDRRCPGSHKTALSRRGQGRDTRAVDTIAMCPSDASRVVCAEPPSR